MGFKYFFSLLLLSLVLAACAGATPTTPVVVNEIPTNVPATPIPTNPTSTPYTYPAPGTETNPAQAAYPGPAGGIYSH